MLLSFSLGKGSYYVLMYADFDRSLFANCSITTLSCCISLKKFYYKISRILMSTQSILEFKYFFPLDPVNSSRIQLIDYCCLTFKLYITLLEKPKNLEFKV